MLYTIQGENQVYRTYEVEDCQISAEVLAAELEDELKDILRRPGVQKSELYLSEYEEFAERVVINTNLGEFGLEERLAKIHDAIAKLTAPRGELN